MTGLHELAAAAGIDAAYQSWRGDPVAASDEALTRALRALAPDLGVAFETPGDAPRALAALERSRWAEIVPPVVSGWDGEIVVPFSVPADLDGTWEVEVANEVGHSVRAHERLFERPANGHAWPGGQVHCVRRARVGLAASRAELVAAYAEQNRIAP
jgi:hypothetical protein